MEIIYFYQDEPLMKFFIPIWCNFGLKNFMSV